MHTDVLVVGGSYAGLAAALQLARARRPVTIVDAGLPRNRFSHAAHGMLGHDGRSPDEIRSLGRDQLLAYPTASYITDRIVTINGELDVFQATLDSGETLDARRVILAHGVVDGFPPIPGIAECWGTTVLHCPYCHGLEVADSRLGVIMVGEMSLHSAKMLRDWSDDVRLFTNDHAVSPEDELALRGAGVKFTAGAIGEIQHVDGRVECVVLTDGSEVAIDALFLAPRVELGESLAHAIGCAVDDGPFGPLVSVDALQQTTVPGVFAAGDAATRMHNGTLAIASGVMAGTAAHRSLLDL